MMQDDKKGRTMKAKVLSAAALAAAVAVVMSGCAADDGGTGAPAGGDNVLRVAFKTAAPSTLDPATGSAGSDGTILWTIFDGLTSFDPETLEVEPRLAESWEWIDPVTLELELVPDAVFHDGTPVDAEAVKFNLDRNAAGEDDVKIAADLANVESVEAVDDTTVVLHLATPSASMLLTLADRAGMMISPTALEKDPAGFANAPVGAGPFQFVRWDTNSVIEVEKFEDYWNADAVELDGIEFQLMPDPQTRLNALRSGDVDLIYNVDPSTVATLEEDANVTVESAPSLAYYQLFMNLGSAPFDSLQVRQAVAMAIDRDELVTAVMGDHGEAAWMPVPSQSFAFTEELSGEPAYDPDRARELLAQGGYPDGFEVDMALELGSLNARRAEIIADQLSRIGITVNLLPGETAANTAKYLDGTITLLNQQWTGRLDPAQTYRGQFAENAFTNVGHFVDPRIEPALVAGEEAPTQEERAEAYSELNQVLIDQAFNVPLYFLDDIVAYSNRVEGFVPNLLAKPRFDGVSLGGR
jgi:ABC-type transport system substrate-binding protein